MTQLTGKTPQERAREEAARKKAAAAKAKEDAKKREIAAAARKKAAEKRAHEAAIKKKEDDRKKAIAAVAKKKADEQKAREAAIRDKERARQLAEKKKADDARKRALAEKRQRDQRAREIAAIAREKEEAKRRIADEKLREQQRADSELVALARGREPFRLFGGLSRSNRQVRSQTQMVQSPANNYLYINEREVSSLTPSNSRIEIDLGEQRARIFRSSTLVIETQISTGKPGFNTPTGRYSVQEMKVDKKSGRYGTWFNSAGAKLRGDDHHNPPSGAAKFVGADMPYWMRITGGIGMHVGYVPNGPASHGCVRVPSKVQPLIFSKVRVGTPITIKH